MNIFANLRKCRQELLASMIWLEPEYFEVAKNISNQHTSETDQWRAYLNGLALFGFENWLQERNPDIKVNLDKCSIFEKEIEKLLFTGHGEQIYYPGFVCNIAVGDFQVCLVTIDNLINDFITIPSIIINSPKYAAHFYILVEVLESEEQLKIYGLLRRDTLIKNLQAVNLEYGFEPRDALIPVSWFNTEVNNLFVYTRFLSPSALALPVSQTQETIIPSLNQVQYLIGKALLNLSDWWNGVYEDNWESSYTNNLAWGFVRSANQVKPAFALGVKPIILQNKTLRVSIKEIKNLELAENLENDVLVKIEPDDEQCLPPGLKLKVTLYPHTPESISKEAIANDSDVAIKLEFSEVSGTKFLIEASLGGDMFIQECVMSN